MIKHIVLWRLKENTDKAADAARIKALLEGLRGRIPGLLAIEVGVNVIADAHAADVALYSEFESLAALEGYQRHPLHLEVVPQVKALATERRSVDYEVTAAR